MAKRLVVGNWKMNPETFEAAKAIARKTRAVCARLSSTEVVVCPPFPFIPAALSRKRTPGFRMGAQSVSLEASGPHTGQVNSQMLKSLGVEFVIAGHSEERQAGVTSAEISRKISMILDAGLTAVVCFGEKARDENGAHLDLLKSQIMETFAGVSVEKTRDVVLAYEPIWAISAKDHANQAMLPEQVYEMSLFVKKVFADVFGQDAGLKVRVLYGGSVNFRNAGDIVKIGKVDGLLVGRESVNIPGFKELIKAVDAIS